VPTVGVFAAIFDESRRILCVKHEYGRKLWHLPGGGVEPGESVHEALRRETREETGYLIEPKGLIGVYSAPSRDDVVLFFEATITGREAWQAGEEISQVAFFGQGELPDPMHPWQQTRVQDAFQSASGVVRVMAPVG
jgi:ADP-ribose pyrophosphatase YjhB (NUDIX family)